MTSRTLITTLLASLTLGSAAVPAGAAEVASGRATPVTYTTPVGGVLRSSDAERLFRGDVPRVSDQDGHYDSLRGLGSKARSVRLQCRNFWTHLRAIPVQPRAIQANLGTIHANAKRLNLSIVKVDRALKTFLKNQNDLPNQRYVSIIDFDKASKDKRLFSIDLRTGRIDAFHVAAGRGSDPLGTGFATKFSNRLDEGNASSLGCYVGFGRYNGKFGRDSLTLHGFEKTNDNACDRSVVIHAAGYVGAVQGRSEGCPAVQKHDLKKVFERVGNGGLICAYRDGAWAQAPGHLPRRRHGYRRQHHSHVRHSPRMYDSI